MFVMFYMLTDTSSRDDKELFYENLNTMQNIRNDDIVMVLSDFNAKVGYNNQNLLELMALEIEKVIPGITLHNSVKTQSCHTRYYLSAQTNSQSNMGLS